MRKSFAAFGGEAIVLRTTYFVLDDIGELSLQHFLDGRLLLDDGQVRV